jgi:predicted secreted hydrolase
LTTSGPEYIAGRRWDWIGINLAGGAALMAFRMRDKQGGSLWAGGALRRADGSLRVFAPTDIRFTPGRAWRSARASTIRSR